MNKEEILKELDSFMEGKSLPYLSGYYGLFNDGNFKGFHSTDWVTGGIGGGSCWNEGDDDDSIYYELHSDAPEKIVLLEEFLQNEFPLVKYDELDSYIKELDYRDNEYYGNHTDYSCAYITFDELADALLKIINK
jgi:hypothetical protein